MSITASTLVKVWRSAVTGPAQSPSLAGKGAAQGILYGGYSDQTANGDTDYVKYASNDYAIVTSRNGEWQNVQPSQGTFNFGAVDAELAALPTGTSLRLNIINNATLPAWVAGAVTSSATATAVMQAQVTALAAHYQPPVLKYVTLVSNWMAPTGGDSQGFTTNPFYVQLGTSPGTGYVAQLYAMCKVAWPTGVKFGFDVGFLDDSLTASGVAQRGYVYQALLQLFNAGVRYDYLANQCHLATGESLASTADMSAFYAQIANHGIEIHLSQIDCNDAADVVNVATRDADVNTQINAAVQIAVNCPATRVIQSNSDTDRYNPLNRPVTARADGAMGRSSLLDYSYRVKTAYNSVASILSGAGRAGAGPRDDVIIRLGQGLIGFPSPSVISASALGSFNVNITNNTGGSNEPPGMTTVVNAGPLTVAPVQVINANWSNGACSFGMTSQTGDGTVATESYAARLGLVSANYTCPDTGYVQLGDTTPGATGYRQHYPACLGGGGYSTVRWGILDWSGIAIGTGTGYFRFLIRVDPNYTTNGNSETKIYFIRDSGAGVNHFIGMEYGPTNNDCNLRSELQIPYWGAVTSSIPAGNVKGGSWHKVEVLWIQEAVPGQSTGSITMWCDGTQVVSSQNNVNFLNPGTTQGWTSIYFDSTFGGGPNPPLGPDGTWWDIDQIYVSLK